MASVSSGAYRHYRKYVSTKYDDEPDSSDESCSDVSDQDYRYTDTDDTTLAGLTQNMSGLQIGREYRRYGYFCCPDCNKTWQSAQAFCIYTRTPDKKDRRGRIVKRGEAVFEVSVTGFLGIFNTQFQ